MEGRWRGEREVKGEGRGKRGEGGEGERGREGRREGRRKKGMEREEREGDKGKGREKGEDGDCDTIFDQPCTIPVKERGQSWAS